MHIEQIYTGCLAQGAYYITSGSEAVIIDPLREIKPYLTKLEKDGVTLKYILETHFHADFVSGHKDLAIATGAKIVFGPTDMPLGFEAHVATDGEFLTFGDVKIQVLHTPGHTMESSCFLLIDHQGKEKALFSGDTLFIGDVGRPDLAQKVSEDLTEDKLARHLYHSLRNKLLPLSEDIIVYPAHGAGSACGKNMSKETYDTLGHQKQVNYALQPMSEDEFVKQVTEGLTPPPAYFPQNVMMNINGYESIERVIYKGMRGLSPEEFDIAANETDALILDTRAPQTFKDGFIPNSINIGIDGSFAPWVGALIPDVNQKILLVTEEGREEEVITRLARVGYDHTLGYLKGGLASWKEAGKELDTIESISADTLLTQMNSHPESNILDVRKNSEFQSEHLLNAENAPLDYINESMVQIDKSKNYFVHCAGGYRSMIFISILKSRGYENLIDVAGGFSAIKSNGQFKVSNYICPSTLL
jgi:glyoxylase-like metal-dependent hydrolase (beta-lactamase superfamily II)/rhodanese-related sulfurtransferase